MEDWTDILTKRDRMTQLLKPHLGAETSLLRATDITQALLCRLSNPADLALCMLGDVDARTAEVLAFQIGRIWEGRQPLAATPAGFIRPRRHAALMGVWT